MIFISAGHGAGDPGAVAFGHTEAALMTELRDLVRAELESRGLDVLTDGRKGENLSLAQARSLVKANRPFVAVELHMNAFTNPKATGVETISLQKDRGLAEALSRAIARVTGQRLRGEYGWIPQSASARGRLGFVSDGGLIVEVAFISNPRDLDTYLKRRRDVAVALADVLEEYAQ